MFRINFVTVLALVVAGSGAHGQVFERPTPKAGFSYPDYYCTNRGVRVEVEDQSCLIIGDKTVSAVCDISLNNPTWRVTEEACTPDAEILKAAKGQ